MEGLFCGISYFGFDIDNIDNPHNCNILHMYYLIS
jgi:hypothetical protein